MRKLPDENPEGKSRRVVKHDALGSRASQFAALPQADQRRLRELALADAQRTPLPTPAIAAWRKRGCRHVGSLWHAACWEVAAVEATAEGRRVTCYLYARMIVALAKRQTAPRAVAA